MGRKLKNSRGETAVEVLASVLIAALSVALLFGAITASVSMDRSAQKTDTDFYEGLNNAQTQATSDSSGTVKVTNTESKISTDIEVKFYGGGGVLSYAP